MNNDRNLIEWVELFDAGAFSDPSVDTQVEAGWFDWFCKDTSLRNKTIVLGKKLKSIITSKKFDPTKCYVFFINSCPMIGTLYDQFKICDIKTREVVYCIVPKSHFLWKDSNDEEVSGLSEVWGQENNFEDPLVAGSWKDVKNFFLK